MIVVTALLTVAKARFWATAVLKQPFRERPSGPLFAQQSGPYQDDPSHAKVIELVYEFDVMPGQNAAA